MDENLQAKIDEAKAAGYSDDEIQAFLNPKKEEPVAQPQTNPNGPVSPWVDRGEEKTALGQYGAAKALELGAELGTGYVVGKKLIGAAGNAFRGTPSSTGSALEQGGQRLKDFTTQTGRYATNIVDRGMDMAQKMRQIAASRVLPAATTAAVPAAVAAGGAAASNYATNVLQNMTPEQRKQYYDNSMLGAMGGDTALGAAIMNQGR